jgi:methylmalonyl-CoA mutase
MSASNSESSAGSQGAAYEQWRAAIRAELGSDCFETRLATRLYEGILVDPLYTREHLPEARTRLPSREPRPGGLRFLHPCAPEDAAELASLDWDLEGVWLRLRPRSVIDDLAALGDVPLERALVVLPATEPCVHAVRGAAAHYAARGVDFAAAPLAFDADPLGALAAGGDPASLEPSLRGLGSAARILVDARGRARCATVAVERYSNAGANAVQEVAAALSTGIAYLRVLEDAGLEVRQAARQLVFRVPVGCDLFLELAKLRALRAAWDHVLGACGVPAPDRSMILHACTTERMLTRRGRSMNLLRATVGAVASILGGADWISVVPLTGTFNADVQRGRGLARSLQLVLWHETELAEVLDPGAGSFYVERLTHELRLASWQLMQDILRRGGMRAVLADGSWLAEIEEVRARRSQDLRCHRARLTGITDFVEIDEPPLEIASEDPPGLRRASEDFEALRDASDGWRRRTGRPPRALLLDVAESERESREAAFAHGCLRAAGVEVTRASRSDRGRWTAAFRSSGAHVGVVCPGSDASAALEDIRTLRHLGARSVCVAARPTPESAHLREAGATLWLYRGADVVHALRSLLDPEVTP